MSVHCVGDLVYHESCGFGFLTRKTTEAERRYNGAYTFMVWWNGLEDGESFEVEATDLAICTWKEALARLKA